MILAIFLGFILILVFWAMLQFDSFQKFISSNQIPLVLLWLIVLTIPLCLLLGFFRNIIRGKGEITNYNKTRILEGFLQLIVLIVLLLVLKQGIQGAVFSYIISIIGATLLTIFLIRRALRLRFFLNRKLLKDSAVYGGKVYLANSLSFLNYRLDMLLIALFLNPMSVGIYSIAVGLSEKLFMIPGAFATVLFPKISSLKKSEADNFTPKIVRHTFFIMLVISLFLIFLANSLIKLFFGSVFLSAVMPLIILLPGIIAFGVGGVLAADLGGRGKPQFAVYSSFTCLMINIPLNILLIPKIGISGAAVASSVAYCADTLVILVAFLLISKKSIREVLLIKREDFQDYSQVFLIIKEKLWKRS